MTKIIYIDNDGTERVVEVTNGESSFMDKVGEQQEMEKSMLDFAENVQPNSRLSCQITISDTLDGLKVTTPESQH